MTRNQIKLENAINKLKEEYDKALEMKFIIKPLAYALYQTWKYYNRNEAPRERTSKWQQ